MKNQTGKRFLVLLMGVLFLVTFALLPAYADDEVTKHSDNAQKYGDLKAKAEQSKGDLLKQIQDIDPQMNVKSQELNKLNIQLDQASKDLKKTEKELADAQIKLDEKTQILKARLKSMYQEGNVGYFEILLDSKNFSEMVNRFEFLKKIAEQDNKLLDEVKAEKSNIEKKRNQQKELKQLIETNKNQVQRDTDNLKSLRNEKEQLIKNAEKDTQLYDRLEAEEYQKAQEAAEKLKQRGSTGPYTGGILLWPTPGYSTITSPFGPRTHPITGKVGIPHTGIDIGASWGADIVAANDGVVIMAQYYGGYGNYTQIDHGGGIVTAYGHQSSLLVSAGQHVKKGQVIGKVGSTGNSTGPHLHFEVIVNGVFQNPVNYVKG